MKHLIQQHVDKYLSPLGHVEIRNYRIEAYGILVATAFLKTKNRIEYYSICAGHGAVGMTRTNVVELYHDDLPLFSQGGQS